MSKNKALSTAKSEKNDEHYTQLADIENEAAAVIAVIAMRQVSVIANQRVMV